MPTLTIKEILAGDPTGLRLRVVAGRKGLDRTVAFPSIQKTGLALIRPEQYLYPDRLQVLGRTEVTYLRGLNAKRREQVIGRLFRHPVPAFLVTGGLEAPEPLPRLAGVNGVPLLRSPEVTYPCIRRLNAFLEERLSPSVTMHGDLLDVFGLGVLLIGKSGIGKSEAALDLIVRGHRLVADDAVLIQQRPSGALIGRSPELLHHHLEIRGLGILNIAELYGISSTCKEKPIELVVELTEWSREVEYDRLGLEERRHEVLSVRVPYVMMPVRPGRNLAMIIEVAARNQLLKQEGRFPAKVFERRLRRRLAVAGKGKDAGK
jgi:HPr kinase/phosphorylase